MRGCAVLVCTIRGCTGRGFGFAMQSLLLATAFAKRCLPLVVVATLMTISSADETAKIKKIAELESIYSGEIFESENETLAYRILSPAKLEPGKKYPLVLFLHGAGERGNDNVSQLVHGAAEFARPDRRSEFPAFVVVPQCPDDQRWVESDWGLESGEGKFPDAPSQAMKLTLKLVDHLCANKAVDPSRCYVTGLSMGGMGSWYAAAQTPKRFAALLEVCGGGDPSWADRYAGIPVWAFHGQADRVVPVDRGREMIKALTDVGHAPELRYVEYPGVGHDSWTTTFARDDVYDWLFAQKRTQQQH